MRQAYDNGWQLLVHTNGDAAVDQLIRLVDVIKAERNIGDHRTVMIHGQFTRQDQITRLKDAGIFPALYPMHTFYWGDWHRDSVAGEARANNISPTGWMIAEGMRFSIHLRRPGHIP